jgi:hypothetical protein
MCHDDDAFLIIATRRETHGIEVHERLHVFGWKAALGQGVRVATARIEIDVRAGIAGYHHRSLRVTSPDVHGVTESPDAPRFQLQRDVAMDPHLRGTVVGGDQDGRNISVRSDTLHKPAKRFIDLAITL